MTQDLERWESAKGFVIVLACAAAVVVVIWSLAQFFTLSPDGV